MPSPSGTRTPTEDDVSIDAIELLTTDHEEVTQLFDDYEQLVAAEADDDTRQELAEQICTLIAVHATIEEEILYPAAREALTDDEDLVEEAESEHQQVRDLITQIQSSDPADEDYDEQIRALAQAVEHHVREEEDEMFPKLRDSDVDLEDMGLELSDRKAELMAQLDDEFVEDDDEENDAR